MKIVIGSDHGGFEYKEILIQYLKNKGIEVIDVGCYDKNSVDYPDIAKEVGALVVLEKIKGIVICGTGIGISIAANKCHGVRAALCNDVYSAKMAREHNDSNVLAIGQRVIGEGVLIDIVEKWLETDFAGERHKTRVDKIMKMEE